MVIAVSLNEAASAAVWSARGSCLFRAGVKAQPRGQDNLRLAEISALRHLSEIYLVIMCISTSGSASWKLRGVAWKRTSSGQLSALPKKPRPALLREGSLPDGRAPASRFLRDMRASV